MDNFKKIKDLFKNKKPNPADKIDITRKRFRWSDFIAEKIIKSVAFLSITIIILIFIFVFRESFPIFNFAKKEKPKTEQVSNTQEQYGVETTAPEKQEQYGVEETTAPEKQEQYGVQTTEDTTKGESFTPQEVTESGSTTDNNKSALKTLPTKVWQPVSDNPRYGLLPLLIGTIKITLISLLFAGPLAILAALYTSVFAPKRLKELIKPTIEMLAGVPSVVIGFFALMVMATFLQNLFGYDVRLNSFVGGIAMGLAAIPIIYTITEDALTAVPKTYYEASLALGASKWQTAFFVILPAATPGIFAAILLGIGRVFGETMIALMATGNAAMMGLNPFESVRTLAATIGAEMAEVVFGDTHYNVLFLIGSMLFIFTFAINAIAEFWVKGKLMKKIQGK
ncbi:MAG: phosphate ABC transporter permease subunit PstC [Bacteroidetes bacterium]|nr:phosphate ABC transporter permease subunit PstC [Bacteroidota bacterium]